MGYRARESSYQRKDRATNFGRTERIGGNKWETMIDVDIDDQLEWTVVFDTKEIVVDPTNFNVPLGRVIAKVEIGSGNGVSETIYEVTDFTAIPVAGNHVKVALTLVSTNSLLPTSQTNGIPGVPAQAPQTAGALVSCFLSAGYSQRAYLSGAASHSVTPAFGEPAFSLGLISNALVSPVPVRLSALNAFNTHSDTGPVFLWLISNPATTAPVPNMLIVKKVIELPVNQEVSITFTQPIAFDRGLVWACSTTPDFPLTIGPSIRVDLELLRRPTVKAMTAIAPTG